MDYLPPERPALVAQAKTDDGRHVYKIVDTGQIDQMDQFDDFDEATTYEKWDAVRKQGLKPGQYLPLCKAEDNQLTFYVQEHKPCSQVTFNAFCGLTKVNTAGRPEGPWLSLQQIKLVSEILKDKLDQSKFDVKARPDDVGGRRVLEISTISKQKPIVIGTAYYLVSNSRDRVIEEVGFKGARKDNKYWIDEAGLMLASVKFVKEGTKRQAP
jgi:hypothetical protein